MNALTPFDIPDINSSTDFMAEPVFANSSLFGITNVRKIVTVADTWEHVAYENTIDENRSSPVRSRWTFLIVDYNVEFIIGFHKKLLFRGFCKHQRCNGECKIKYRESITHFVNSTIEISTF